VPLGVLAGVVPFFPHGAASALALIAGATLVCVVHVVTAIAVL
jgi:hypothetical protein